MAIMRHGTVLAYIIKNYTNGENSKDAYDGENA